MRCSTILNSDEFLATISHELRTPLTNILGWAQMLRSGKLDEATFERAIHAIDRNARLQAQLINDLVDMSEISSGGLQLDIDDEVSVASAVSAACDAISAAARSKEIEIEEIVDPIVGAIPADADRLQQIIWILLSNAVKFTPRGGKISIGVFRVLTHVELRVSDTGEGISPSFLPYVFDRFRQADSKNTRAHGGLGLGLALARELVELHGGTISAESPGQGEGATFTVLLPLIAPAPKVVWQFA